MQTETNSRLENKQRIDYIRELVSCHHYCRHRTTCCGGDGDSDDDGYGDDGSDLWPPPLHRESPRRHRHHHRRRRRHHRHDHVVLHSPRRRPRLTTNLATLVPATVALVCTRIGRVSPTMSTRTILVCLSTRFENFWRSGLH